MRLRLRLRLRLLLRLRLRLRLRLLLRLRLPCTFAWCLRDVYVAFTFMFMLTFVTVQIEDHLYRVKNLKISILDYNRNQIHETLNMCMKH